MPVVGGGRGWLRRGRQLVERASLPANHSRLEFSMSQQPPDSTVHGDDPDLATSVHYLARQIERAYRRLDELNGQVASLADQIAALLPAEIDGRPASDTAPIAGPGVRSWLLADDPDQAAADLGDLAVWLWRVYLWFPDASLSSCWLWHPEVIEELWWLRVAHADAFDPDVGSSMRAGDWHDRQRPGVARRVRSVLAKCDLNRHAPVNGRDIDVTPPGPPAMAGHTGVIAAVWTAGADLDAIRAAGPLPTPEQLEEANVYQQALYRSRR